MFGINIKAKDHIENLEVGNVIRIIKKHQLNCDN